MLVDKVRIGASRFDGRRAVLAARPLKAGEVVCTVPFSSTISAETPPPTDQLLPSTPTYVHTHRLFAESPKPRAVEPAQLQQIFLGCLVAHMRRSPALAAEWGPYLETLKTKMAMK